MPAVLPVFSARPHRPRNRGSVLIVALLLAAVIALVLGSYLSLNLGSTRLAKRSFQGYAALNLAEAGAEEAVWSFNRAAASQSDAWDGWQPDSTGTAAFRKFSGFDFGQNTSGSVKVHVTSTNPPAGTNPRIIVLAAVNPPEGNAITRMLEITLRRRSHFANGLVAKNSIVFNGAVSSVDSWNSDPDNDPATPAVPYSTAVRRDGGTIASLSVLNTATLINQASIWGYVFTGGAQPQVGTQGSIRGADTPPDVAIDSRRIATDFNADLPDVAAPADGTVITTVGATLGTVGTTTRWRCPGITLNGRQTLTILGNVTLILTAGPGVDALSITGNASLIIPVGSSLTIYTEGNIRIAGNGVANANTQPATFQLWGTTTSLGGQDFQIAGNGALKSIVYAPNASVKINGNGDVMGSVVANTITLTGNAAFHYDEALAQSDRNTPFGIVKWRELNTASERAVYNSLFTGW